MIRRVFKLCTKIIQVIALDFVRHIFMVSPRFRPTYGEIVDISYEHQNLSALYSLDILLT